MGCDIHIYVEKKIYKNFDRTSREFYWISADKWTKNPMALFYPEEGVSEWHVKSEDCIYTSRNYLLFTVLAGVRNTVGVVPISEPRGLPENVSNEIRLISDEEGQDAHSHSWLLGSEVLDYDWDQEIRENGVTYTYRQCCNDLLTALTELGNPQDFRIVFWFDN